MQITVSTQWPPEGVGHGGQGAIMPFKLAEHQRRLLSIMDEHEAWGIFAEAGTGKTIIAITWIYNALMDGRISDALVICPASLVPNWQRSITDAINFEGYAPLDIEILKEHITVISYNRTWQCKTATIRHRDGTTETARRHIIRPEIDKHWGAIFVDESHGLGAYDSLQTQTCLKLARMADYRYILTGTPDGGQYIKLYGQFNFLHPGTWSGITKFREQYVKKYDHFGTPIEYRDAEILALKEANASAVRLRDCFDMPEETHTRIPCPLAAPKEFRDILEKNTVPYNFDVNSAGVIPMKLLQLASGFLSTNDGPKRYKTSKTDAIKTIVDGTEDKIVIFYRFSESGHIIAELLDKMKISYYLFNGEEHRPLWQQFQTDDTRVFITQYTKGNAGLDLYAAHTTIFYEPAMLSAIQLIQARARTMRKGQRHPCTYYYLETIGTAEPPIWDRVTAGADVSERDLIAMTEQLKAQYGIQ